MLCMSVGGIPLLFPIVIHHQEAIVSHITITGHLDDLHWIVFKYVYDICMNAPQM